MNTFDPRKTAQKAGDLLMVEASKLEGISGTLTALASDEDGLSLVSKHHRMRALELLSAACDQAVIRLSVVHSLIEALEADAAGDPGREGRMLPPDRRSPRSSPQAPGADQETTRRDSTAFTRLKSIRNIRGGDSK